jgi:crotonobetainyl-CoA:carnitine CoA-transferase CaiB-like acyl-CoA transferase
MKVDFPDGDTSGVSVIASPLRLSASPVEYRSAPPRLGGETRGVLQRLLGFGEEQINNLIRDGIVRA